MNISGQEDALITTLEGLKNLDDSKVFKTVASIGRKARPKAIVYPAAFACFVSDSRIQSQPRTIMNRRFGLAIVVQNVAGEKQAADNLYDLIDTVLGATVGKNLSLANIGPFQYGQGAVEEYEDGRISYLMILETNVYFPVVRN